MSGDTCTESFTHSEQGCTPPVRMDVQSGGVPVLSLENQVVADNRKVFAQVQLVHQQLLYLSCSPCGPCIRDFKTGLLSCAVVSHLDFSTNL